ncbi:c-type cytochrome domain-containing protein [Rubellicoccus peritrichatus]|uniref:C-type cytochrome domain-containing protein n=1 Tax=Rubellicoccus peritrichatus TaxID=3080537 RepID=A0AAQ3L5I0_9BACT|nr:c-type cytochrome domain-containing protein [Puniceicoccus sp. CR14]WOO39386.1 c-type cytochrome domain-containing protein [Puniceicoccus sp. CR14]
MKLDKTIIYCIVVVCVITNICLLGAAFWLTSRQFESLPTILLLGGNLHPLLLHLPIGIFIYVITAEVINLGMGFTKSPWRVTGIRLALAFGVVTSYLAAAFGLMLYMRGDYEGELIQNHLWWGVGFAISASVVFIVSILIDNASLRYRVVLFSSVALMSVAGHYGGLITHGDPLDPLWEARSKQAEQKTFHELLLYEDVVTRVFETKCYDCHSVGKKKKGGLLMDSHEALLAGGKKGPAVVPGSLDESLIVEYIHLPEDHELHMPPEGKPQLTNEELALIDAWVAAGAPQLVKLADAELPDEQFEWARVYMASKPEPEALQVDTIESQNLVTSESNQNLAKHIFALESTLGSCISRYGPAGDSLAFSAVNIREAFDDSALNQLKPLMPYLIDIDLSKTQVTSSGVAEILRDARQLKRLNLSATAIDDNWAAGQTSESLEPLEHLILFETRTTPESIPFLSELKQLKSLYLGSTALDNNDLMSLRQALPNTEIIGQASL